LTTFEAIAKTGDAPVNDNLHKVSSNHLSQIDENLNEEEYFQMK
jgi:hypothetical protein